MVKLKLVWIIIFISSIFTAIFSSATAYASIGGENFSIFAAIILIIASLSVLILDLRFSILLIGFFLPTLPALGDGSLDLIISFWVIGIIIRMILSIKPFHSVPYLNLPHPYITRGLLCFNLIFILGFISSYERFIFELNNFTNYGGISKFFDFTINSTDSTLRALKLVIRSTIITSLTFTLLYTGKILGEKRIRTFLFGLICGTSISAFIAILQNFGLNLGLLSSYNINLHIWLKLDRSAGLFSDPNSFGVFVALLIPVLVLVIKSSGKYANFFAIGAITIFLLSLLSGSRTELIGIFCFSIYYFYSVVAGKVNIKLKRLILAGIALFALSVVFIEPFNNTLISLIPISSVHRILDTLNYKNFADTLYSREIYIQMTKYVWLLSPIIGVGLGRFHDLQADAADTLNINLLSWRDNSNNFYMGILAEEGIIGFIILIISFFYIFRSFQTLKIRYEKTDFISAVFVASRVSLIIFAILLITGPHIYFQEIAYIVAILLALSSINGNFSDYKFLFISLPLIVAFLSIIYLSLLSFRGNRYEHSGFYDIEKQGSAYFRWSEKKAQFAACNKDGEDLFYIKAITPSIERKPIAVDFSFLNGSNQEVYYTTVILRETRWKAVIVPEFAFQSKPYISVKMEINRTWKPNESGYSQDSRELGVMLKWGESVCLR